MQNHTQSVFRFGQYSLGRGVARGGNSDAVLQSVVAIRLGQCFGKIVSFLSFAMFAVRTSCGARFKEPTWGMGEITRHLTTPFLDRQKLRVGT